MEGGGWTVLLYFSGCSCVSYPVVSVPFSCAAHMSSSHERVHKDVLLYTEGQYEVAGLFPAASCGL